MEYVIIGAVILFLLVIIFSSIVIIVPQQAAFVVERFGQFSGVLKPGLEILIPFMDRVAYRHSLKERAIDTANQICITQDNVQVEIDGLIYLQVTDPAKASYGAANYEFAIVQLAQTTVRSEVGKMRLDDLLSERDKLNQVIVNVIDEAAQPWGVKVWRYEVKGITPPRDISIAMEKQLRAEREKRANILEAEGVRDAEINKAEGNKQKVIKESEAKKMSQINEAEGQAAAILAIARATAQGIAEVSRSLTVPGGDKAMELRIAEKYLEEFGKLAKSGNTFVLPANLSEVGSMLTLAKGLLGGKDGKGHSN